MSGKKTTYTRVRLDELNRLRRQAAEASSLAQSNQALTELGERTDRFLEEQHNRVNNLNDTMAYLNRTMERRAAADSKERQQLREQLGAAVRRTNDALAQMAERNQRDLANLSREFQSGLAQQRAETVRMIEVSNQQMNEALEDAVGTLERQIDTVSARIDDVERQAAENARRIGALYDSDEALLELAREYAETARILNEDTARNFRVEMLLPGRLAQAQSALQAAEGHIADVEGDLITNAPMARQSAREAAEAALQLHEDVVRAEQEWQMRYFEAQQSVSAALAQVEASRTVPFPDEEASVDVDVDLWSNGDLTALADRAECLRARLDAPDNSIDDLVGIAEAASQTTREILETTEFAVIAMSASQDRADIAADVADYLRNTLGLVVQSHGYQGDDQRGAHRIHLKNPRTRFEMVVTQYPESDGQAVIGNRLESDILDYGTNNQQVGDAIAYQALSALSGLGFLQTEVRTEPGYENRPSQDRERADMEAWREQAPAAVPGPVRGSSAVAGVE